MLTAKSGPVVAYGKGRGDPDSNLERAPSFFDMGTALLDPRAAFGYAQGQRSFRPTYGFAGTADIVVLDVAPATAAANNIAASQTPVAGTALTLTAGAGVTSASVMNNATGQTVTGLVLDGTPGAIAFGQGLGQSVGGPLRIWDPQRMLSRTVRVTSVGNDSGATFTVRGLDCYGFPLTQTVTGGNAGAASTSKAFKTILSVTPAGTLSGSAVTVGTNDVFGFPLRVDQFPYTTMFWAGAPITANTGLTPAVTTSPATALTGDVRGTYAVQSASDGTKRLVAFVIPQVNNLSPNVATGNFDGMFGVPQV